PANDDAIRSIQLIISKLVDAVIEGKSKLVVQPKPKEEEVKQEKVPFRHKKATGAPSRKGPPHSTRSKAK
ncbi:MAG: 30S ribosomal protein S2, partial [Planctomycetota bacterium]